MIWTNCLRAWPGATHSSVARSAAMGVSAVFGSTMILILLAGCGSSTNAPPSVEPRIAARPDVIVTLDGKRHACLVALYSEAQGSIVACEDIVPFIRDELRVSSGSIYDIRTIPDVDPAEMAKVETSLKSAGYRFIGGPRR